MSESEPRPELEVESGVVAGGQPLACSIRAFMRRISRTSSSVEPGPPDERLEHVQQPTAEVEIAGYRPGAGHGLALPGERVALEVGEVPVEAARQRPLLALGS